MKKILTTLLVFASVSASAKTIKLYSAWQGFADEINPEFVVNADLGRAWVNVITVHDWDEDTDEDDNFVKVEGLSYKQDTQEVIYADGNTEVVCAVYSTRGRGIFRSSRLRNSGNCKFIQTTETKSVDDGFYVRTKKYDVISLKINI